MLAFFRWANEHTTGINTFNILVLYAWVATLERRK